MKKTNKEPMSDPNFDKLEEQITGDLVSPESGNYDEVRAVWNGMIDKRPSAIVRCQNAADVAAAVNFARDESLSISIRGNGHNIAGTAVVDDGLVIDLSGMKEVRIDPAKRRAWVEPGATLAEFDAVAQEHGLATPVGVNSTTGISGLALGGGYGWLSRRYGMTIDNLKSCEVVTADGRNLVASTDSHPDLFWALRGGGGNFGVVTRFEFQLHPVGPEVLSGIIGFLGEEAGQVYQKFREFAAASPQELAVWPVIRKAPPLPFIPEEYHGQLVLLLPFCHCGDPDEAAASIAPIREFGNVVGEFVGVQPYAAWQQILDPLLDSGARNYWKSRNFTEISDGMIDLILEFANRLPTAECEIFLAQIGGATSRVEPGDTAYWHRDAQFVLNVHGRWRDPGDDEKCIAWAREFFEATKPFASAGVYSNFMTADEAGRAVEAYGGNYEKLAAIKAKYDSQNFFRLNTNIRPA